MEGTRVRGEAAVYAAKARRASLDGEHAVIGWKSKANNFYWLSLLATAFR